MQILPWLAEPLRQLVGEKAAGRLPHALLVTGQAGVGKGLFARALAEAALCTAPGADGAPCGRCAACGFLAREVHPDLMWLRPEEEGKQIKIDAVRRLCSDLAMTSHGGGYKVAIIEPADAMNTAAANALLKTLEEPTDGTLMILVSGRPARLLATIRSRCRRVVLPVPPSAVALDWLLGENVNPSAARLALGQAKGAPLAALAMAGGGENDTRHDVFKGYEAMCLGRLDPVAAGALWSEVPLDRLLGWMQDWTADMIRLRFAEDPAGLAHVDLRNRLAKLASRISTPALYAQMDALQEARRLLETTVNKDLLLETLLIGAGGSAA